MRGKERQFICLLGHRRVAVNFGLRASDARPWDRRKHLERIAGLLSTAVRHPSRGSIITGRFERAPSSQLRPIFATSDAQDASGCRTSARDGEWREAGERRAKESVWRVVEQVAGDRPGAVGATDPRDRGQGLRRLGLSLSFSFRISSISVTHRVV
jgi:hypothetical protein